MHVDQVKRLSRNIRQCLSGAKYNTVKKLGNLENSQIMGNLNCTDDT